jgi:hypothetical protein
LAVNTFFMINGLTRKVESIQDLNEEMGKSFRFDQHAITPMKIKNYFGMKGLVMIALGIGLGYHTILLGSTAVTTNLIIMDIFGTTINISTYYHRSVLFFCMAIVLIAIIEFKVSKGFRAEFVNHHSFRHALAMFGDLFRRKEDGSPAPVQTAIMNQAEKIVHFGEKLTTDIKDKLQKTGIKGFWNKQKKDGNHPK